MNTSIKNTSWTLTVALAVVLVVALAATMTGTALAGEGHKHEKCTADAQACVSHMMSKIKSKGWLGIETDKAGEGRYKVTAVTAGSPAAAAGFEVGDVLLAVNGVDFTADKEKVAKAKANLTPGAQANYVVERAGAKQKLTAQLGQVPEAVMAEWIGQHMIQDHAQAELAAK